MMLKYAVAALVLVSAGSAQALDCNNAMTQVEMNQCAFLAYEAADGDLNYDYGLARDYMKELDTYLSADQQGAAKALLDAQRLWIPYRDAACQAEGYTVYGGTMQSMVIANCRERLTRARSEDLRILFEQN